MQALVLREGALTLETDRPEPEPADGEIRVRVTNAGVCETDLQLVRGYMGFDGVLGHEFVGVAETGPLAGRRVVGEINCPCGACPVCRRGHGHHCPHRTVLGILGRDGAFADVLSLPEANLLPVPDAIDDTTAVFTEPLAAACRIPQQIPLTGSERVIVLGDGRLGNLCAQVLHGHGCRTTLVGKHTWKLERARAVGLETALLDDVDRDDSADLVVDATGSPSGLETSLSLVRPLGTVVVKTTVADEHRLALSPVVIDEVTLIGSRCGPFDVALEWLAEGRVDVSPLVTETRPLSEGVAAIERAAEADALKVLLRVSDGP